jgi:hypothetical protein
LAIAEDTISVALASASASPLARLGVAEGGLARPSACRICACFSALGAQDLGLPLALGLQDVGALDALGLHLPAHRLDEVARRHDVLDLDAGDLDAPRRRPRRRPRAAGAR